MNEQKINSPTSEQIAEAIRNHCDPDKPKRVASRLYETLTASKSTTVAAMQVYARLHGNREAKS